MRFILDANTLIYLVKANLSQEFINLIDNEIIIDKSVYNEVVEKGIENNYPDAYLVESFLEVNQIPIIPVNITSELSKFRDPGETSCYILAKSEGLCISSDIRAIKKFNNFQIPCIQLDTFFYKQFLNKKIRRNKCISILRDLKNVNGTSANRISIFFELILNGGKKDE